jgi:uncharacterized protein (DUF58 family)
MELDLKPILLKIRQYEIRIRKAINARMRGSFASVFKGSGLEFDDLRMYQYGDDVRRIDWNASAKSEETYVKVFKEEKEQTVFFLLDVSGSLQVSTKFALAKELCGVLAFSAIREGSEAGLIAYSNQKELYIKPDKGMKKAYEIVLNLYKHTHEPKPTDLTGFLHFALNLIKRRSIVFFISDFIDDGYQDALISLAKKHDVIVVHLTDKQELELLSLGLIPVQDIETNTIRWLNTSSKSEKNALKEIFEARQQTLQDICKQYQTDYFHLDTQEDFVSKLIKLFKVRNQKSNLIS